jgi:AcrR family transcriptional regulator
MSTKAQQLIDAAVELFDERGYRATGIDAILERAGVAKMTLYKHFGTKDELIVAALRAADERSRAWMIAEIERRAADPRDRMLALFDFARDWVTGESFRGCMFIRAAGEFAGEPGEGGDPVHAACAEHLRLITRFIEGLAVQAGARDPGGLSLQLILLFQGVLAAGQSGGGGAMIDSARAAAGTLLDAHGCGAPGAA